MQLRQTGDNLAAFALAADILSREAHEEAVRRTAHRSANEIRRTIRRNFKPETRLWDAPDFHKTIRVKMVGPGHYRVFSKARYVKGRTQAVDLLWVFDQGPTVRSGAGKVNVAIPLKEAPIAPSGRRHMWPSEAIRAGFDIYFATVIGGKGGQIAFGRRNSREPYVPWWYMRPSVKMPKRLDLDGIHRRHAMNIDDLWGEIFDQKVGKIGPTTLRRIAA